MNITNLEMTQATIEIFGAFICLMLAVIIMINGHERGSWRLLKWMFFTAAGIFLSDGLCYIFRGDTDPFSLFGTRFFNFMVFILNMVLVFISVHYVYSLLHEKGVTPPDIYKKLVFICLLAAVIILVSNIFTGWMYSFDESNYYHRHFGWYIYTGLNLASIIILSVMSLRYTKSLGRGMAFTIILYAFAPIIAIVLQTFIYGMPIIDLGIFIAMLLMLLVYLREWSISGTEEETDRKGIHIIILFVMMTISMSASILSCIICIERISDDNSENVSVSIAHMVSDGIESEFIKPIVVAQTMANDVSLKDFMEDSGNLSAQIVEKDIASYLDSIRTGFGYQMVFAVCDKSRAYYTYDGISKFVDLENSEHDIWYKNFLEEGKHYDLDVDTDEANQWELSVFVNTEIVDDDGNFLGVCGVGIKMTELQEFLKRYEKDYDIKINLIDSEGLIQIDTDGSRIENAYMDTSYLSNVNSDEFYYERRAQSSLMTKYLGNLDWYLVVEDKNPDKLDVARLTVTSIIIFAASIILTGIAFTVLSIRQRKAAMELVERRRMSMVDDMTGLFNRRAYDAECDRIKETDSKSEVSIIMMDLNGLKAANDTFGHSAGDELILGMANCMQTSMGELGRLYRIGGDEFVALFKCEKDRLNEMLVTFNHVTSGWRGTYQSELSVSIGMVVGSEHEDMSFDEMRELADKLMYESKDEYYRKTGKKRRKI